MNESMYNSRQEAFLHWAGLFGIAALVVLGTAISIFSLAAFCVAAMHIVFGDEDFSWQMMFFLAPFSLIFKPSPGSTSLFTFVLLLFVVILFQKHRTLPSLWLFFAFYLWAIPALTLRPSAFNIMTWIKVLCGLLMIYYYFDPHASHDEGKVFLAFAVGMIASSFTYYLDSGFFRITRYIDEVNTIGDAGAEFRDVVRFAGLSNDPNYYSANLIISMCLLVVLLYQNRISIRLFSVLFVLLLYFNISTYSKSAMLMLVFPVALLLYAVKKAKRRSLNILLAGMVIAALVFLVVSGGGAFSVILSRFGSSEEGFDVNKMTTGRVDRWIEYLEFFKDNPGWFLVGKGLSDKPYRNRDVHNAYIEAVYRLGLLGTGLYLVLLKQALYTAPRAPRKNPMNYCLIIFILIEYVFLNMILYYDLPFHIVLVFAVYNMSLEQLDAWQVQRQKGSYT